MFIWVVSLLSFYRSNSRTNKYKVKCYFTCRSMEMVILVVETGWSGYQRRGLNMQSGACLANLGPLHTFPDSFESATFSFWIRLPSTRIQLIRQWIRIFLNRCQLSWVERNWISNEPDNESGFFLIVSNLLPNNKPVYGETTCRPGFSRVIPDSIGCVWTGEFDLNAIRVEGEISDSRKKTVADSKISGYVWPGRWSVLGQDNLHY